MLAACVGGGLARSFVDCGGGVAWARLYVDIVGGGGSGDEGAFEGVRDRCAGLFPSLARNPALQRLPCSSNPYSYTFQSGNLFGIGCASNNIANV